MQLAYLQTNKYLGSLSRERFSFLSKAEGLIYCFWFKNKNVHLQMLVKVIFANKKFRGTFRKIFHESKIVHFSFW